MKLVVLHYIWDSQSKVTKQKRLFYQNQLIGYGQDDNDDQLQN